MYVFEKIIRAIVLKESDRKPEGPFEKKYPPPPPIKRAFLIRSGNFSRGRQPLGLVAQNREEEMSKLFKIFTFIFFSDLGSTWSKKNEEKKFFESDNISDFQISDFQSIFVESKTQKLSKIST